MFTILSYCLPGERVEATSLRTLPSRFDAFAVSGSWADAARGAGAIASIRTTAIPKRVRCLIGVFLSFGLRKIKTRTLLPARRPSVASIVGPVRKLLDA